jgi:hypothetical protein
MVPGRAWAPRRRMPIRTPEETPGRIGANESDRTLSDSVENDLE